LTGGKDPETDSALRTRFQQYIASLTRATIDAVAYAITSVQAGLTYTITENYSYAGVLTLGYFYAVVDDGSGAPSATLLGKVSSAIETVRPLGSSFGVYAATVEFATVAMSLTIPVGNGPAIRVSVYNAIIEYLNALPVGASCSYTMLSQIAYNTSPLVTNVTGATLNGGTSDLTATKQQVIKAGAVNIT